MNKNLNFFLLHIGCLTICACAWIPLQQPSDSAEQDKNCSGKKNIIFCIIFESKNKSNGIGKDAATGTSAGSETNSTPLVATPIFSPVAKYYTTPQNLSIITATSGANIYYTLDGSIPTTSSTAYITPIHIWSLAGKTVNALATKTGFTNSVGVLNNVFTYPPLKSGQTISYQVGDDGAIKFGVARSYSGPTSHTTYTSDYITTDNATGLVWKTCSQGLSGSTCTIGTAVKLTWDNANGDATNGCNALNNANNGNGYAGRKTWRLPAKHELETLVDYGTINPPINITAFPNTIADFYWSSTSFEPNPTYAWYIVFSSGSSYFHLKTDLKIVRCVSGLSKNISFSFIDNGDGTVKDNATGFIWQKCSFGQNPIDCSGTAQFFSWTNANILCTSLSLASKTWRLPNVNELKTILDTKKTSGASLDTTAFPNTITDNYWSSSTSASSPVYVAWDVNFLYGYVGSFVDIKTNSQYVRCLSSP